MAGCCKGRYSICGVLAVSQVSVFLIFSAHICDCAVNIEKQDFLASHESIRGVHLPSTLCENNRQPRILDANHIATMFLFISIEKRSKTTCNYPFSQMCKTRIKRGKKYQREVGGRLAQKIRMWQHQADLLLLQGIIVIVGSHFYNWHVVSCTWTDSRSI